MDKSYNKITFYESICYANKKTKTTKYDAKKFYRYFYLKSAAVDYIKYKCERNLKYKIFEVNIYKHYVIEGRKYKDLVYKKNILK
jgi:hypothetical protein